MKIMRSWNTICFFTIFFLSKFAVSQDYDDAVFVTKAGPSLVNQNQPVLKHSSSRGPARSPSRSSPSRPSPSRPSPTSRPASRPSPTSRPASRPSPTSRPAARPSPSPTSRPAPSPTYRPATRPNPSPTYRPGSVSSHKPIAQSTARPYSPPSTYRPASPSTYRPASPSTYRPASPSTYRPASPSTYRPASPSTYRPASPSTYRPASPSTYRPASPSTYRPASPSTYRPASPSTYRPASPSTYRPSPSTYRPQSPSTYRPYTTQRSVALPPTSRPYTNSWTTHRPSQPAWTPAQSRTLAPPLGFTTGRPPVWNQGGSSFQSKPKSSGGLSSLFKSLTGSGGSSGSGLPAGQPSKMAKVKQLATALYGAYKARQLKKKVSRNQYQTYSPYYGRNYYYGNRYYRNTNPGYRMTCYYYVPSNDPTYDMYYEDQNRVTEIVYECDAQYERCCGTVDCCRGTYAVNGRGMGTGQSVYVDDRGMGAGQSVYPDNPGYQGTGQGVHTGDNGNNLPVDTVVINNSPPPEIVDESNPQVTEVYAENYNFANLSDEDFLSFNETIYAADNETVVNVLHYDNYTIGLTEYNRKIRKL